MELFVRQVQDLLRPAQMAQRGRESQIEIQSFEYLSFSIDKLFSVEGMTDEFHKGSR